MTKRKRSMLAGGLAVIAVIAVVALVLGRRGAGAPGERPAAEGAARIGAAPAPRAGGADPRRAAPASVEGTVRDGAGAPIASARVCADSVSAALPSELTREPSCALTDARGDYRIAPLLPAMVMIGAMAKGHLPATFETPAGAFRFPLAAGEHRRVDLVLGPGGVEVTGVVEDLRGGPIAHARVQDDGLMVEADEAGRYTLWTRGGPHWFFATADGYATGLQTGDAPGRFDFALTPAATLAGKVVDAAGQPVTGARVTAEADGDAAGVFTEAAISDDDGRFAIGRLAAGRYVATAHTAHGYGTSAISTLLAPGGHADGVTVKLAPAYQILGRVTVDTARTPCIGAFVRLIDEIHGRELAVVREPDGTLRADGIPAGTYFAEPTCEGMMSREHYPPIAVVDRDVDVAWPVDPGAAVLGRVRNPGGGPVMGVLVSAELLGAAPRRPTVMVSAVSRADGAFALRGLPHGRYRISADPRHPLGSPSRAIEMQVEVTGDELAMRDLVVDDAPAVIAGRVVGPDGKPVTPASVSCAGDSSFFGPNTDAAGGFRIEGLAPGPCKLVASAYGHPLPLVNGAEAVVVTARAGATATAELVVAVPRGTIRGTVVDDRGEPAADAFVTLAAEQESLPGRWERERELGVGADGSFLVPDLGGAAYTVRAYRRGGSETLVRHVAVGASVTVQLPPTGEIDGVVRRGATPPGELAITVTELGEQATVRTTRLVGTEGAFALRDLPPGRYRVAVRAGAFQAARDVEVTAGAIASVELQLEGLVTLIGRVIEPRSHRPLAGVSLSVSTDTSYLAGVSSDLSHVTDADGRFELRYIPRGPIRVDGQFADEHGRVQSIQLRRAIAPTGDAGEVIDLGELRATPSPEARGSTGFSVTVEEVAGAPAIVTGVDPGGPADRAGLVVGDVITAVDGIDVTGGYGGDAPMLLEGAPGVSLTVTVKRGLTVTIVLEP